MNQHQVVFESPQKSDHVSVKGYVRKNILVWIIEPFYAYHHEKGIRFFPPQLPSYILELLTAGKIKLIKHEELNAKEIYFLASDRAVAVIDLVFPEYRKEHKKLFEYVCDALKSSAAENVFKKNLCDRLAEFYSVNILMHRVEKFLGSTTILFYPDTNVRSYQYLKTLLLRSNQDFFEHPNIRFPIRTHVTSFSANLKEYLIAIARLYAQTLASGLLYGFHTTRERKKKSYSYGVAIVSPSRQQADNQRGPDFLIDNVKILPEDVVYFPLVDLTNEQKKQLSEIPGTVYYPPKAGWFFSNFVEWQKLLRLAFIKNFLQNGAEIKAACSAFLNYFKWLRVLENIKFRHFITHCDFGMSHVGRNLALNHAGVQTWYFTDSMNSGLNFKDKKNVCRMRHPFWTYLNYDHFVTWDNFLAQYYKDHPTAFKESHIVGCLWSGHIKKKDAARDGRLNSIHENMKDNFVIAAFDTTYTRNGLTSYAEGIAFAEHLLKLVNNFPAIRLLIKEKKNREMHYKLDPVLGPKLLNIYKEMDGHPGITTCSEGEDASDVISIADMVISFPFTSTTFEALSVNKPAIWHDPLGYYIRTPYAKAGGVTTHSYDELKLKIREIKSMGRGVYRNPFPKDSPLMDPHRDGRAIGRFRELLTSPKA